MALNIRNPKTEELASQLAALTGETKTEAVTRALEERLAVVKHRQKQSRLDDRLDEIARHCASLPVLDKRKPDAILYDKHGLPN